MIIPVTYQFYGPQQEERLAAYDGNWQFLKWPHSIAFTANTVPFWFNAMHCRAQWATFNVIWRPNSGNKIRLCHMDNVPAAPVSMAEIIGTETTNPVPQLIHCTAAFNALVDAVTFKHLTFQIAGNNVALALYSVNLQVGYIVP